MILRSLPGSVADMMYVWRSWEVVGIAVAVFAVVVFAVAVFAVAEEEVEGNCPAVVGMAVEVEVGSIGCGLSG